MNSHDLIEQAYEHYDLLPVGKDSKACLVRDWHRKTFAKGHLLFHAKQGGNIGAKVGATRSGIRVLVVDRDARDMESWRQFIQKHGLAHRCTMAVDTASGNAHYWFRLDQDTEEVKTKIRLVIEGKKLPLDIKSNGYVLFVGSHIGGKAYQFRDGKGFKPPEGLSPLPGSVIDVLMSQNVERPEPRIVAGVSTVRTRATAIVCPEKYVLRIPSIQGQHGSGGLVRAICVLRDSGWDGPKIYDFMCNVWNPACAVPEWSREDIARAINRHCGDKR